MACYSPFHVEIPGRLESVPVPCGRCPYCLQRRVSSWAFRLRKQDEVSKCSFFITLTYEKPPMSKRGFMTLTKRDIPLFFKRFRNFYRYRALNPDTGRMKWYYDKVPQISYYAVGEYGSDNWRPHYHIIFFSAAHYTKDELMIKLYKAWDKGYIDVGTVTGASVAYVLKYVQKPSRVPLHKNDDRLPEFSLMSKGLGSNYLTDNVKDYHRENLQINYVIQDGFKLPVPRYYRERILSSEHKLQQRKIIRKLVEVRERVQSERFYDLHPLALQVDYETYKSENRLAAYNSFFKNVSPRKL